MTAFENIKILVVDDSETIVSALEFILRDAGCKTVRAMNGREAYRVAIQERPHIIISDVNMPEMDGIELCKALRALPEFSEIPFIFLTVLGDATDRLKGIRAGADDYIVKPFNADEIVARVHGLFERLRRSADSKALAGSIEQVSVMDIIQMFEHTKKEGALIISSIEDSGIISLKDGMVMDVGYGAHRGEDALCILLTMKKGRFRFEQRDVAYTTSAKPIRFVIMEVLRLIDEKSELSRYMPDREKAYFFHGNIEMEDSDMLKVAELLKTATLKQESVKNKTGLSEIRVEVALAKLAKLGCIKEGNVIPLVTKAEPERIKAETVNPSGKPVKILFAYINEAEAFKAVNAAAAPGNKGGFKTGMADFLEVKDDERKFHLFLMNGEKKISFLWEPLLAVSYAAVFFISAPADIEQMRFFKEKVDSRKIPFRAITNRSDISGKDIQLISGFDSVKKILIDIVKPASGDRNNLLSIS